MADLPDPQYRWRVPIRLADVPESGLHLDLVADQEVRTRLIELAGLRDLPRLEVAVDLVRDGEDLRASGRVCAVVGQVCGITLEPMESLIDEPFDVTFAPPAAETPVTSVDGLEEGDEPVEALVDGVADLGALATEFLLLAVDPYPRKPGAVFVAPTEPDPADGPFASLAVLKPKREPSAD
jgi:uncharacterized metal-binding protein YceD (DUF177 family)